MTFLNPAVLVGLLAAAIPVILHFINLRKIKRIEFGTIRFLKELKKSRIRNLKIKQWLLLFLRLSAIVFLVLAFAKPAVKSGAVSAIGETAKKSVAVVLDNSYGMFAKTDESACYALAKKGAEAVLSRLSPNDAANLFFTAPARKAEEKDLLKTLRKSNVSFFKGNLSKAFELAAANVRKEKTLTGTIYVFSDFQKNNLSEKEIKNAAKTLGENVKIVLVDFTPAPVRNLTLCAAEPKSQIFFPGKTLKMEVDLKNFGQKFAVEKTISLFINGERTAQNNVALKPSSEKRAELNGLLKNAGVTEIVVASEDDDIPFDNKRFVSLETKARVNILVTAKEKRAAENLLLALSEKVSSLNKTKFVRADALTNAELENADVLFAVGGIHFSAIKTLSEKGKTLVIFPDANAPEAFIGILRELTPAANVSLENHSADILFDKIDFDNPLFVGVFGETKTNINSPRIAKNVRFESNSPVKKIISLENDAPFLFELKKGKGKIFVFTVPPNGDWSDFQFKPIFAPLMNRIALYSASAGFIAKDVKVGEPYYIDLEKLLSPQIKIEAPNEKEYFLEADYKNNGRYLKFTETETPGFYYVYSGDKLIDKFTVNTDTEESERKFLSKNDLRKIFGGNAVILEGEKITEENLFAEEKGSELWRFFLIAALFAAFGEMFVARTSRKEFAEFEEMREN